MRHIVGKLSTSSFQRYKVCANRSSDEGVMAPGSRGVGAVFVHSSDAKIPVKRGMLSANREFHDVAGVIIFPTHPGSRINLLRAGKTLRAKAAVREKKCVLLPARFFSNLVPVPDSRESELGLVRYGPASRVHRGVFGPFEGSFPIGIPADPDKFLAIREFHVVHGCVLFPMCPGSQINLLRVRKTLCASVATSALHRGEFGFARYDPANGGRRNVPYAKGSTFGLRFRLDRRSSSTIRKLRVVAEVNLLPKGLGSRTKLQRGWSVRSSFWSGQRSGQTLVKLGQPWSNLVIWSNSPNSWEMYPGIHFEGFWARRTLVGLGTARSNLGQTSVNPSQTWSTLVKLGQTLGNVSRTFFLGVFDAASPRRIRPAWFRAVSFCAPTPERKSRGVQDPKRTKLGPRAIKSVFVDYAVNSKAYRLLDLSSNTIVESRDVEFIENKFINDSQIELKQTQESDSLVNDFLSRNKRIEPSSLSEQRRSQRVRKEKDFGPDFISYQVNVYLVKGNREKVLSKLPFVENVEEDPNTYSEAMVSKDVIFWREAVNNEMDSILSNNTWVLVDLPLGSNTIGCKWVFRRKYRTDGTIQTFKVRLVAKGFRQREGIDYFDTYAPVARITSIRVLIALASIYKLVIHQMDVKTAFLNGDLDEEVYMDQLEGFVLPGNEKKVCKLVKSLYGLKQAPKQWHEKFDTVILANSFKHNEVDKCVYSKFTVEYGVIVCLYVDDMLIFRTNMLGVCETKKYLASVFKMKDLNEADTILGIKVKRHSEGYALCQSHYIEKVLHKYKHLNVKEVNTPFDFNYKLVENNGRAIAQLEFASAIGSMMYVMHCTRLDIAFAVNRLSRYTSNPNAEHWKAIARVLVYLKKTKDL
uniref:Uncharacterized protein n=1 Tax=Fagus sylvatica TaxID=28930 RepID=A0A2N9GJP7_FAGSY